MASHDEDRPDPDLLLEAIQEKENKQAKGRLHIFLGMCAGVGKSYSMLEAAHERKREGIDVVIGYIETHGRKETERLVDGLELVPRKKVDYKGTLVEEMDLDAILQRRPKLVVVDELPHSNVATSRHPKRYQDVIEILEAGIDVYTALNVQHLESRKESVEQITGIVIRETVPDSIVERAAQVELIDITPEDLLKRLREGKVYLGERAQIAAQNFFKEGPLTALREIALRMTAERVDQELQEMMDRKEIAGAWKMTERLMVAVSHSPYSKRLIRTTRRLAYNLEAPWIAVNIETGLTLNEEDQSNLAKNLELARELGAEVITTTDTDVSRALQRVARQRFVTQIVVGRPVRRFFSDLLEGGTLLDKLIRTRGDVDIHVIRQEDKPARQGLQFRIPDFSSGLGQYYNSFWYIVCLSILAYVLNSVLPKAVSYQSIGFIYLLGVLFLSLFVSKGPVFFGAILSAFVWNYAFIPPIGDFSISTMEDLIMSAVFLVAALTSGVLTGRIRKHEMILREREDLTQILYQIVSVIASSPRREEFLKRVTDKLSRILKGECSVLLKNSDGHLVADAVSPQAQPLDEKEIAVATWALESGKPAGWSTQTLPLSQVVCHPLRGRKETVGVFAYRPKTGRRLTVDQETLLEAVVRQLAVSLEHDRLEENSRESHRLMESERLHQVLLSSVSHELRSPLATIKGVASAFKDPEIFLDEPARAQLLKSMMESCDRLDYVIENLIDMARVSSGNLRLKLEWIDLTDLLQGALLRVRKALSKHQVSLKLPVEPMFIQGDVKLLEHVMMNLMLNAARHTPKESNFQIVAQEIGDAIEVGFLDDGPGIPAESLPRIFDKFYRVPGTAGGGVGLGLSIAKTLIEAHHGRIRAENRSSKGAAFTVTFPLAKVAREIRRNAAEPQL